MHLFVLGILRSDTTLVQQIVPNHPEVGDGGLPFLATAGLSGEPAKSTRSLANEAAAMRAVLKTEGLLVHNPGRANDEWHNPAGIKVFKGGQRASAPAWLHTGSRAYSLRLPQQVDACLHFDSTGNRL